jgi:hypothetical protein
MIHIPLKPKHFLCGNKYNSHENMVALAFQDAGFKVWVTRNRQVNIYKDKRWLGSYYNHTVKNLLALSGMRVDPIPEGTINFPEPGDNVGWITFTPKYPIRLV